MIDSRYRYNIAMCATSLTPLLLLPLHHPSIHTRERASTTFLSEQDHTYVRHVYHAGSKRSICPSISAKSSSWNTSIHFQLLQSPWQHPGKLSAKSSIGYRNRAAREILYLVGPPRVIGNFRTSKGMLIFFSVPDRPLQCTFGLWRAGHSRLSLCSLHVWLHYQLQVGEIKGFSMRTQIRAAEPSVYSAAFKRSRPCLLTWV